MAENTPTPRPTMLADTHIPGMDGSDAPDADVIDAPEPPVDTSTDQEKERALALGWKPIEKYKGAPEKWKPAKQFLEYGEHVMPVIKQDLARALDSIGKLQRDLAEKDRVLKDFTAASQKAEERIYKQARLDLLAEKKQAIKDGDGDRVVEIDEALEALKPVEKPPAAEAKPVPPPPDPAVQAEFNQWITENEWVKDPVLETYASAVGYRLRAAGDTSTGRAFMDKIAQAVRRDMPEKFENQRRRNPPPVDGGGHGGGGGGGAVAGRMNQEQEQAFARFVRQGLFKNTAEDRKRYLAYYAEQE